MNTETEPAPESARLTVDVALFGVWDGMLRVLLIRRAWPPFEGCWALPGGYVDLGEDVEPAAYRELTEETRLRIGPCLKPAGVYSDPGRDPRGRMVSFAYTARLGHCPPAVAGDDAAAAAWFPLDVLDRMSLAFDHARIIRDALRLAALPGDGRPADRDGGA